MLKSMTLLLIISSADLSFSQDTEEIETDRPDQTECSSVIPLNTIQIETGIAYESDNEEIKTSNLLFPTTLIRIGVSDNSEFRIIAGEYSIFKTETDSTYYIAKGFSPLAIGLKLFTFSEKKYLPRTSLIFHIYHDFLPFSINQLSYEFRVTSSKTLLPNLDMGYNFAIEWNKTEGDFIFIYTLTTAFAITKKFGAYIEIFGDTEKKHLPHHQFDGGLTFLLQKNIQLDCSAGIALNKNSTDKYISTGLSWRIPR